MEACMLVIQNRWLMYNEIKNKLNKLINKDIFIVIDEGRSRKRKEKAVIKGVYNRIFTIKVNDLLMSFSYSDLICKTITLLTM